MGNWRNKLSKGECVAHVDSNTETTGEEMELVCQKFGQKVDAKNAKCQHRDMYCKFRSSCLIYFAEREAEKEAEKARREEEKEVAGA